MTEEIEQLAQRLGRARRMVAFTGAGVSTESDIPDFRSEGGVYQSIEKAYGRPPEVLLSHGFFERHPEIFFDYLRRFLVFPKARPNPAHRVLAALEKAGMLALVVTQNIDSLHTLAGSREVCELHGSLARSFCTRCGRHSGPEYLAVAAGVPRCVSCGGVVRPDVVLYGEALDPAVTSRAAAAIARADLLLVAGTSLAVYPAAGLLDDFTGESLILLNKTPTPRDACADLLVRMKAGDALAGAAGLLGLAY